MLTATVAGIALFYAAPLLTSSSFFRITCGSAMITTGLLVILAFMLMRWEYTSVRLTACFYLNADCDNHPMANMVSCTFSMPRFLSPMPG